MGVDKTMAYLLLVADAYEVMNSTCIINTEDGYIESAGEDTIYFDTPDEMLRFLIDEIKLGLEVLVG